MIFKAYNIFGLIAIARACDLGTFLNNEKLMDTQNIEVYAVADDRREVLVYKY